MRVSISADWQFDPYFRLSKADPEFFTTRLRDFVRAWDWWVESSVSAGAEAFVVAGDLFENRESVPVPVLSVVGDLISRLTDNYPLVLLPGNHDSYTRTSYHNSLKVFSSANVVSEPTFLKDIDAIVMPWSDNWDAWDQHLEFMVKTHGEGRLLISHLLLNTEASKGYPVDRLRSGRFRHVFLGDVHEGKRVGSNIDYVASPLPIDYRDTKGFRGFMLFDSSGPLNIRRVENTVSPQFHVLSVSAQLGRIRKGDFVRVDAPPDKCEMLANGAAKRGAVVEQRPSRVERSALRLEVTTSDPVSDVLRRYVDHAAPGLDQEGRDRLLALGLSFVERTRSVDTASVEKAHDVGTYTLGPVHYVNYGPFEDVVVDFSVPGLTVLNGRMENQPGANDNGCGKTFLLEGVVWCFTGRSLRKYKGNDVVREVNPSAGAMVEATLVGEGLPTVSVIRYQGHPEHGNRVYFWVGDESFDGGTDTMTTALIARRFPQLEFDALMASAFFAAREDVKDFFSSSDSDRKALMDSLLSLEWVGLSRDVADQEFKSLTSEYASHQDKANRRISAIDAVLSTPVPSVRELELREARLSDLALRAGALSYWSGVWSEQARDIESRESVVSRALHHAQPVELRGLLEARAKLEAARREAAVAGDRLSSAKRHRDSWKNQSVRTCPTCKQVIKNASDQGKHVAKAESDYQSALHYANAADLEVTACEAAVVDAEKKAKEVEADSAEARRNVERSLLWCRHFRASYRDRASVALSDSRVLWTQAEAERRSLDGLWAAVESRASRLADEQAALDREQAAMDALVPRLSDLQFWVEGFGNSGVKSFLIESELASVNDEATAVLTRLSCPGAFVRISPTSETKTGKVQEKMMVQTVIPGCTTKAAGASKGQRRRLGLALLLAFRKLLSSRVNSIAGMFVDEVFDGMDAMGVDVVVDLLKDAASKVPVVLVTHDSRLKGYADRTLTVVHDGKGTARVV